MNGSTSTWTNARVAKLKTLWINGLSASQCARELGDTTRNAVIGKVNRMMLPPHSVTVRKKPVRKPEPRRVARARPMPPLRMPAEPIPAETDHPQNLIPLSEWPETNCKWGYEVGSVIRFGCTCKKLPGLPYCAGHAQRAYQPPRVASDRAKPLPVHHDGLAFKTRSFA